jgi:hypothetical protein
MSYNYTNNDTEAQPRFPYDFDRNTEIPLYVPVNEATGKMNRSHLNIQPKTDDNTILRRWTLKRYQVKPDMVLIKYPRKSIVIERPQPSKFAGRKIIERDIKKMHGLPDIQHKAPVNEASIEFNLKGKTTADIVKSNLLKAGGKLDDFGARIEGHNNGTSLDDAVNEFMLRYNSKTKLTEHIGKQKDKEKAVKTLQRAVRSYKARVPVAPVVNPTPADEQEKNAKAMKIQQAFRRSRNTTKSTGQIIKAETTDFITPPKNTTRPRSNTSPEERKEDIAKYEGKEEQPATISIDTLSQHHKSQIRSILKKKLSENLTATELKYLNKNYPSHFPDTTAKRVKQVQKIFKT